MVVFVLTPQRAKNVYDEVTGELLNLAIDRADELLPKVLKDNELLSKMKENSFNNSLKTITGKAYYEAFSNMIFEKWKIKI